MSDKYSFVKSFPLLCMTVSVLCILTGCSGNSGGESFAKVQKNAAPEETYQLTEVYHMQYLPVRNEDGLFVRKSVFEWNDGTVIQHCASTDFLSAEHRNTFQNIFYDADGNVISSKVCEVSGDYNAAWFSSGETLFRCVGSDPENGHTFDRFLLEDHNGVCTTEALFEKFPFRPELRNCGDYYLAFLDYSIAVFDDRLRLLQFGQLPVENEGDTLVSDTVWNSTWSITDIWQYGEDTAFLRCEISEEVRKYNSANREYAKCFLLNMKTGACTAAAADFVRTEETRNVKEIYYSFEQISGRNLTISDGNLTISDGNLTISGENPSLIPYFSLQDGIYRQDNGVNTLLLHFGNSGLNPERLHILQALPNDRFLAEYTNPLTELTQTVFLIPAPDTVTHAKPVTIAAVGVTRSGGYGMLTDMVTIFNQSQEEYRVSLRAYGLNNSYFTKNTNESFSELEKDIIEGNFCDLYIFGLCPYDVNAIDMYESLLDKNVFLDLEEFAEAADILPSVTEAYRVHGTVSSLPLWMWYETLYTTDIQRMAETEYGTARLNAETDALKKGELYLGYDYDLKIVREVGLCSFYDREAGTCSFDTEEFLTFLSCMDRLSADYVTKPEEYADFSRAQEQRMLADGSQLYGMAEFQGTAGISEILYAVQDTPFAYAGFPLLGKSVYIRSDLAAAVMKNTAVPDGAKAFLAFLFSDDVQTGKAMAALGLPVTERALTAAFPVGYNYYFADTLTQTPQYQKHSSVRLSEENRAGMTEALITTEQRDDFLDYLRTARLHRAGGDKTILSIIEEELSAADAGVRSRAEAAKIIQNRVMLYLNE